MDREDIINKVFPHALFGYDPVAVDAFLDEVIMELDRMSNTIDVLQFKLANELGEARQTNDLLSRELHRVGYKKRVDQLIASGEGQNALPGAADLLLTEGESPAEDEGETEAEAAELPEEPHRSPRSSRHNGKKRRKKR
ncbi:MAG: DivIVA domain-containing protein [Clostridia bacterium]|nr:DivIVA domain-containing protein [Clostridia bacterium]